MFSNKDPILIDLVNWALNIGVDYGTKTVGIGSMTLTANSSSFCYTWADDSTIIPCTPGKTYVIEWESSGATSAAMLYPNGNYNAVVWADSSTCKLEYTAEDGVTYFTFGFGVYGNTSATLTNIRITEKDCAFDPGAIWIQTGTSSPAEFDALKKNSIMVYPISAKQYVGGAWVDKTMKIYQGGTWIGMYQYIIRDGVLLEPFDTGFGGITYSNTCNKTIVTQKDGYVEIKGSASGAGFTRTSNALDFTNATALVVEFVSASSWSHENATMAVWNNKTTKSYESRIAYANMKSSGLTGLTLDVSGITGLHYAGFETVGNTMPFNIVNMYLVMG